MGVPDEPPREISATNKGVDNPSQPSQEEHPELYRGLTRVQHMVEKGVTEVPEAFIQPPHMRASARSLDTNLLTPVIDMALLNRDEEGKKQVQADITRACEEWGFFRVIDHLSCPHHYHLLHLIKSKMDIGNLHFSIKAVDAFTFR